MTKFIFSCTISKNSASNRDLLFIAHISVFCSPFLMAFNSLKHCESSFFNIIKSKTLNWFNEKRSFLICSKFNVNWLAASDAFSSTWQKWILNTKNMKHLENWLRLIAIECKIWIQHAYLIEWIRSRKWSSLNWMRLLDWTSFIEKQIHIQDYQLKIAR